MYRYVECEKFEGKTCRTGGSTERSIAALKHLPKVGKLEYVRGYIYKGRGTTHAAVLVRGDLGSMRFGGFSWGYYGTGCRGLQSLLNKLGVSVGEGEDVESIADLAPWACDTVGEYWRITFGEKGLVQVA